jgi:aldose 1-epimerase
MAQFRKFGIRKDGRPILAYELKSDTGFKAVILNQGAILQGFYLPNGQNITLGFDNWEDYAADKAFLGRIVGPNANRILGAHFRIDEEEYRLVANDGANNLHSGPDGFDNQIWEVMQDNSGLALSLETTHKYNGFPGNVRAQLKISLKENRLRLGLAATSDRATPMNMTWHPYWRLSRDGKIDNHDLCIASETISVLETGTRRSVKETYHDFRKALPIGSTKLDNNYKDVQQLSLCSDNVMMTVTSSLPDMQVYTGDGLPNPRSGIAVEPQYQPNDINLVQKSLLRPSETYRHWIEYKFDLN